jgi:hypothetical protein
VPWCKYFIPKISVPGISPDDPSLNDHIMYAKCVKGHVLRDAADWIQCENLPAPDAPCWQEGGETLFTLAARKRREERNQAASQEVTRKNGKPLASRS